MGYQGAGPDPVGHFCVQLTAAGGVAYQVPDLGMAFDRVLTLVLERSAARPPR